MSDVPREGPAETRSNMVLGRRFACLSFALTFPKRYQRRTNPDTYHESVREKWKVSTGGLLTQIVVSGSIHLSNTLFRRIRKNEWFYWQKDQYFGYV